LIADETTTGPGRRGGSFFGRRKGKALRPGQKRAVETLLPTLLIDLSSEAPRRLATLFPVPVEAVRLEIGFGGGEHLLHQARTNPTIGFLGVEPFEAGLAKAVTAIGKDAIQNVRLYDQDAALLLDWLPDASLARVDLLFPDPWPKKRHWKRRFVRSENLDRIRRCLVEGGELRFASDVESYAEWARETVAAHGGLRSVRDSSEPWDDWPGTRYEAKAARAGRGAQYMSFRKEASVPRR
jgi:tRNA (guanine-N7-)-methyltransferase